MPVKVITDLEKLDYLKNIIAQVEQETSKEGNNQFLFLDFLGSNIMKNIEQFSYQQLQEIFDIIEYYMVKNNEETAFVSYGFIEGMINVYQRNQNNLIYNLEDVLGNKTKDFIEKNYKIKFKIYRSEESFPPSKAVVDLEKIDSLKDIIKRIDTKDNREFDFHFIALIGSNIIKDINKFTVDQLKEIFRLIESYMNNEGREGDLIATGFIEGFMNAYNRGKLTYNLEDILGDKTKDYIEFWYQNKFKTRQNN